MPDTPSSAPDSTPRLRPWVDSEASDGAGTSGDAASISGLPDTDVLLPDEPDTADPPEPPSSAKDEDDIPSVGSVLDFGEAGAYTLEERLGRGGMGEVYRARQVGAKGFSQTVAIKRLRRDGRASHEQSFVDEARVLSRLHHEHIAHVYAFLEHEGSQYLVMEYIEGQTLHAL